MKGNDIFYLFLNGRYLHAHLLQGKSANIKKGKVKDARKREPERRWNRSLSTDGRVNLQERQGSPSSEAEQEGHKLASNTNKIKTVRSVCPGVS